MKNSFLLGFMLFFFLSIPAQAQKQSTLLTSKQVQNIDNGNTRSGIALYDYYNIGYYYLGQNSFRSAERYFKKADKYIQILERDYKFSTLKAVEDEQQRLKFESDNLQIKDYVTNANLVLASEIDLYKSIVEKSYAKSIALVQEARPYYSPLFMHIQNEKAQSRKLKQLVSEHGALKKRKTEFETQQEFKKRFAKYVALELQVTRKYQERSKNIGVSFKEALSTCRRHKSKIEKQAKTNAFIKKYPPTLKPHNQAHIKSMEYNAEKEIFTLVVEIQDAKQLYKYNKKRYEIRVPRSQAPHFKQQKVSNKYLFFLQDLRAVVSGGNTYKIEPIHTWYTKLNCEEGDKKAVLIVNNQRNTTDVQTYLETAITNEPEFLKAVERLKKSYLRDYARNVKANIFIFFDKKGNYKKIEISYMQDRRFATVNGDRNGDDKQGSWKRDLLRSVSQAIKKKRIRVDPPTKQCEPQKSEFRFEYVITPK